MRKLFNKKSLSLLGVILALILTVTLFVTASAESESNRLVLVDTDTEWYYLDNGSDAAYQGLPSNATNVDLAAWTAKDYTPDSAYGWKTSSGTFGSKKGVLGTINSGKTEQMTPTKLLNQYYSGTSTNIETIFFRTTVTVENLDDYESVYIDMVGDDGFCLYINGHIVVEQRNKTSGGAEKGNMFYASAKNGSRVAKTTIAINKSYLVEGENVICAQVHNESSTSSDVAFGVYEISLTPKAPPAMVEQLVLSVGGNQCERRLAWFSPSADAGEVRLAKASEVVDGVFPSAYKTFSVSSRTAVNVSARYAKAATLTGLEADTKYAYTIVNDGKASEIRYFTTDVTGDFDFVYVGDPQISTEAHGESWQDTLRKIEENFGVDLLISGGDQVNTANDETLYSYLIKDELLGFTFAPTVGPAHDSSSATFSDHFNLPNLSTKYGVGKTSANYWYVYNNVLFMHLNMEDNDALFNGEHEAFISETVAANPTVKWTILVAHRAPFSTGLHGDPTYKNYQTEIALIRPALSALATKMDIDIVLSAHDHVYVRTHMLENDQLSADTVTDNTVVNPEGVLYITANSSTGSKFYDQRVENAYFVAAENYEKRKSAIRFEVTDTSITLTSYFLDDMSVFDTFTIEKTEVNFVPDGNLVTPYGIIDEAYADKTAYPIAVFDNAGNFVSACATLKDAYGEYFRYAGDYIVFLRDDLATIGGNENNFAAGSGNKIIDLNGKTINVDSNFLFRAEAKAYNGGVFKVTVKNGTINVNGKNVWSIGAKESGAGKRLEVVFESVVFKNINSRPIISEDLIPTSASIITNATFNDCTFENPAASLFNIGNQELAKINVTVNGCKIITSSTTAPTIVAFGEYKSNATFTLAPGADGKCLRIYMPKSDKSFEIPATDNGLVFAKSASASTEENDVYVLSEKTPYGYVDEEHLDAIKYPMVLYLGDTVIYPVTYGEESGDTVVQRYFRENPSKNAVLYFRTDYTITGKNYWTGNINSTFVIDFGGNTITGGTNFLYMQSRSAGKATIIVKNGTFVPNGSVVIYGTVAADKKHSEITFENVVFKNIKKSLLGTASFSNTTPEREKYTMSANIYFNNCTFDVASSLADPLFNFGSDTRGTINVYVNGGSVNFAGTAKSIFKTAAGTPRTFTVNSAGDVKTIVTLPGVAESYVLISANVVAVGKSVSLGELVDMNVYIKFLVEKDVIATLVCGDRSVTFNLAELEVDANGNYKLSLPLTSIMMAEDVTLTIDGGTYTTSIKEYAEELIASDESDSVKALAKALLNYGAAAQEYFAIKNNTDTLDDILANAGLVDADKVVAKLTATDLKAYEFSSDGMTSDLKFTGATLTFSSKTYMKVYFKASADATVTVNGKTYTKAEDDEMYYVTVIAETPAEAMNSLKFVITDGNITISADISVFTAVHAALSNCSYDTELVNLVTAYARYCEIAKAYVA